MSPLACDLKALFYVFSLSRVYSVHSNCEVRFLQLVLGWGFLESNVLRSDQNPIFNSMNEENFLNFY